VVGQFGGPLASAFGQIALGQRLQPPNQTPDQPDFVAGAGRFAEQFGILVPELTKGKEKIVVARIGIRP
jgi:hypothetical protein